MRKPTSFEEGWEEPLSGARSMTTSTRDVSTTPLAKSARGGLCSPPQDTLPTVFQLLQAGVVHVHAFSESIDVFTCMTTA